MDHLLSLKVDKLSPKEFGEFTLPNISKKAKGFAPSKRKILSKAQRSADCMGWLKALHSS